MEASIELADAIEAVRSQLIDAAARGAGQPIQFEVGPVELEFTVELRRSATAKGGVKAWVFSADAEADIAHQRVHKVALTLTPRLPDGSVVVGSPGFGSADGFAVDRG